ncbi:MAG: hypothetical protein HQL27_03440, partial [Candidatus Omnitrophica bacterium]|nr:hypothetical protein [Candidatus Omnitrophota bacterium]
MADSINTLNARKASEKLLKLIDVITENNAIRGQLEAKQARMDTSTKEKHNVLVDNLIEAKVEGKKEDIISAQGELDKFEQYAEAKGTADKRLAALSKQPLSARIVDVIDGKARISRLDRYRSFREDVATARELKGRLESATTEKERQSALKKYQKELSRLDSNIETKETALEKKRGMEKPEQTEDDRLVAKLLSARQAKSGVKSAEKALNNFRSNVERRKTASQRAKGIRKLERSERAVLARAKLNTIYNVGKAKERAIVKYETLVRNAEEISGIRKGAKRLAGKMHGAERREYKENLAGIAKEMMEGKRVTARLARFRSFESAFERKLEAHKRFNKLRGFRNIRRMNAEDRRAVERALKDSTFTEHRTMFVSEKARDNRIDKLVKKVEAAERNKINRKALEKLAKGFDKQTANELLVAGGKVFRANMKGLDSEKIARGEEKLKTFIRDLTLRKSLDKEIKDLKLTENERTAIEKAQDACKVSEKGSIFDQEKPRARALKDYQEKIDIAKENIQARKTMQRLSKLMGERVREQYEKDVENYAKGRIEKAENKELGEKIAEIETAYTRLEEIDQKASKLPDKFKSSALDRERQKVIDVSGATVKAKERARTWALREYSNLVERAYKNKADAEIMSEVSGILGKGAVRDNYEREVTEIADARMANVSVAKRVRNLRWFEKSVTDRSKLDAKADNMQGLADFEAGKIKEERNKVLALEGLGVGGDKYALNLALERYSDTVSRAEKSAEFRNTTQALEGKMSEGELASNSLLRKWVASHIMRDKDVKRAREHADSFADLVKRRIDAEEKVNKISGRLVDKAERAQFNVINELAKNADNIGSLKDKNERVAKLERIAEAIVQNAEIRGQLKLSRVEQFRQRNSPVTKERQRLLRELFKAKTEMTHIKREERNRLLKELFKAKKEKQNFDELQKKLDRLQIPEDVQKQLDELQTTIAAEKQARQDAGQFRLRRYEIRKQRIASEDSANLKEALDGVKVASSTADRKTAVEKLKKVIKVINANQSDTLQVEKVTKGNKKAPESQELRSLLSNVTTARRAGTAEELKEASEKLETALGRMEKITQDRASINSEAQTMARGAERNTFKELAAENIRAQLTGKPKEIKEAQSRLNRYRKVVSDRKTAVEEAKGLIKNRIFERGHNNLQAEQRKALRKKLKIVSRITPLNIAEQETMVKKLKTLVQIIKINDLNRETIKNLSRKIGKANRANMLSEIKSFSEGMTQGWQYLGGYGQIKSKEKALRHMVDVIEAKIAADKDIKSLSQKEGIRRIRKTLLTAEEQSFLDRKRNAIDKVSGNKREAVVRNEELSRVAEYREAVEIVKENVAERQVIKDLSRRTTRDRQKETASAKEISEFKKLQNSVARERMADRVSEAGKTKKEIAKQRQEREEKIAKAHKGLQEFTDAITSRLEIVNNIRVLGEIVSPELGILNPAAKEAAEASTANKKAKTDILERKFGLAQDSIREREKRDENIKGLAQGAERDNYSGMIDRLNEARINENEGLFTQIRLEAHDFITLAQRRVHAQKIAQRIQRSISLSENIDLRKRNIAAKKATVSDKKNRVQGFEGEVEKLASKVEGKRWLKDASAGAISGREQAKDMDNASLASKAEDTMPDTAEKITPPSTGPPAVADKGLFGRRPKDFDDSIFAEAQARPSLSDSRILPFGKGKADLTTQGPRRVAQEKEVIHIDKDWESNSIRIADEAAAVFYGRKRISAVDSAIRNDVARVFDLYREISRVGNEKVNKLVGFEGERHGSARVAVMQRRLLSEVNKAIMANEGNTVRTVVSLPMGGGKTAMGNAVFGEYYRTEFAELREYRKQKLGKETYLMAIMPEAKIKDVIENGNPVKEGLWFDAPLVRPEITAGVDVKIPKEGILIVSEREAQEIERYKPEISANSIKYNGETDSMLRANDLITGIPGQAQEIMKKAQEGNADAVETVKRAGRERDEMVAFHELVDRVVNRDADWRNNIVVDRNTDPVLRSVREKGETLSPREIFDRELREMVKQGVISKENKQGTERKLAAVLDLIYKRNSPEYLMDSSSDNGIMLLDRMLALGQKDTVPGEAIRAQFMVIEAAKNQGRPVDEAQFINATLTNTDNPTKASSVIENSLAYLGDTGTPKSVELQLSQLKVNIVEAVKEMDFINGPKAQKKTFLRVSNGVDNVQRIIERFESRELNDGRVSLFSVQRADFERIKSLVDKNGGVWKRQSGKGLPERDIKILFVGEGETGTYNNDQMNAAKEAVKEAQKDPSKEVAIVWVGLSSGANIAEIVGGNMAQAKVNLVRVGAMEEAEMAQFFGRGDLLEINNGRLPVNRAEVWIDIATEGRQSTAEGKQGLEALKISGEEGRKAQRTVVEKIMKGIQAQGEMAKAYYISRVQSEAAKEAVVESMKNYLKRTNVDMAKNVAERLPGKKTVETPAYAGDGVRRYQVTGRGEDGRPNVKFIEQEIKHTIEYKTADDFIVGVPAVLIHKPTVNDDEDTSEVTGGYIAQDFALEDVNVKAGDQIKYFGKLMLVFDKDEPTKEKAVIYQNEIYALDNNRRFTVRNQEEAYDSPLMITATTYDVKSDRHKNKPDDLEPRPFSYRVEAKPEVFDQLEIAYDKEKAAKSTRTGAENQIALDIDKKTYKAKIEFPQAAEHEGEFNGGVIAPFQNFLGAISIVDNKNAPINAREVKKFSIIADKMRRDLSSLSNAGKLDRVASTARLAAREHNLLHELSRRPGVIKALKPLGALKREADRNEMDQLVEAGIQAMRDAGQSREKVEQFESDVRRLVNVSPKMLSDLIELANDNPTLFYEISNRPNVVRELSALGENDVLQDSTKAGKAIEKALGEVTQQELTWRQDNRTALEEARKYIAEMEQTFMQYRPNDAKEAARWKEALFSIRHTRMILTDMLDPKNERVRFYFNSMNAKDINRNLEAFMDHVLALGNGKETPEYLALNEEARQQIRDSADYFKSIGMPVNDALKVRVQHELRGRFTAAHAGRYQGFKNLFMGQEVWINDFFEQIGKHDLVKKSTQVQRVMYTAIHEGQGLSKIASHEDHVRDLNAWEQWKQDLGGKGKGKFSSAIVKVSQAQLGLSQANIAKYADHTINLNTGVITNASGRAVAVYKADKNILAAVGNSNRYEITLDSEYQGIKAVIEGRIESNGTVTEMMKVEGPRALLERGGLIKKKNDKAVKIDSLASGRIRVNEVYEGDYQNTINELRRMDSNAKRAIKQGLSKQEAQDKENVDRFLEAKKAIGMDLSEEDARDPVKVKQFLRLKKIEEEAKKEEAREAFSSLQGNKDLSPEIMQQLASLLGDKSSALPDDMLSEEEDDEGLRANGSDSPEKAMFGNGNLTARYREFLKTEASRFATLIPPEDLKPPKAVGVGNADRMMLSSGSVLLSKENKLTGTNAGGINPVTEQLSRKADEAMMGVMRPALAPDKVFEEEIKPTLKPGTVTPKPAATDTGDIRRYIEESYRRISAIKAPVIRMPGSTPNIPAEKPVTGLRPQAQAQFDGKTVRVTDMKKPAAPDRIKSGERAPPVVKTELPQLPLPQINLPQIDRSILSAPIVPVLPAFDPNLLSSAGLRYETRQEGTKTIHVIHNPNNFIVHGIQAGAKVEANQIVVSDGNPVIIKDGIVAVPVNLNGIQVNTGDRVTAFGDNYRVTDKINPLRVKAILPIDLKQPRERIYKITFSRPEVASLFEAEFPEIKGRVKHNSVQLNTKEYQRVTGRDKFNDRLAAMNRSIMLSRQAKYRPVSGNAQYMDELRKVQREYSDKIGQVRESSIRTDIERKLATINSIIERNEHIENAAGEIVKTEVGFLDVSERDLRADVEKYMASLSLIEQEQFKQNMATRIPGGFVTRETKEDKNADGTFTKVTTRRIVLTSAAANTPEGIAGTIKHELGSILYPDITHDENIVLQNKENMALGLREFAEQEMPAEVVSRMAASVPVRHTVMSPTGFMIEQGLNLWEIEKQETIGRGSEEVRVYASPATEDEVVKILPITGPKTKSEFNRLDALHRIGVSQKPLEWGSIDSTGKLHRNSGNKGLKQFIVSERVEGKTAGQLAKLNGGNLSDEDQRLVGALVEKLIANNYRINDFSPRNVMIGTTKSNPNRQAYVIDAGSVENDESDLKAHYVVKMREWSSPETKAWGRLVAQGKAEPIQMSPHKNVFRYILNPTEAKAVQPAQRETPKVTSNKRDAAMMGGTRKRIKKYQVSNEMLIILRNIAQRGIVRLSELAGKGVPVLTSVDNTDSRMGIAVSVLFASQPLKERDPAIAARNVLFNPAQGAFQVVTERKSDMAVNLIDWEQDRLEPEIEDRVNHSIIMLIDKDKLNDFDQTSIYNQSGWVRNHSNVFENWLTRDVDPQAIKTILAPQAFASTVEELFPQAKVISVASKQINMDISRRKSGDWKSREVSIKAPDYESALRGILELAPSETILLHAVRLPALSDLKETHSPKERVADEMMAGEIPQVKGSDIQRIVDYEANFDRVVGELPVQRLVAQINQEQHDVDSGKREELKSLGTEGLAVIKRILTSNIFDANSSYNSVGPRQVAAVIGGGKPVTYYSVLDVHKPWLESPEVKNVLAKLGVGIQFLEKKEGVEDDGKTQAYFFNTQLVKQTVRDNKALLRAELPESARQYMSQEMDEQGVRNFLKGLDPIETNVIGVLYGYPPETVNLYMDVSRHFSEGFGLRHFVERMGLDQDRNTDFGAETDGIFFFSPTVVSRDTLEPAIRAALRDKKAYNTVVSALKEPSGSSPDRMMASTQLSKQNTLTVEKIAGSRALSQRTREDLSRLERAVNHSTHLYDNSPEPIQLPQVRLDEGRIVRYTGGDLIRHEENYYIRAMTKARNGRAMLSEVVAPRFESIIPAVAVVQDTFKTNRILKEKVLREENPEILWIGLKGSAAWGVKNTSIDDIDLIVVIRADKAKRKVFTIPSVYFTQELKQSLARQYGPKATSAKIQLNIVSDSYLRGDGLISEGTKKASDQLHQWKMFIGSMVHTTLPIFTKFEEDPFKNVSLSPFVLLAVAEDLVDDANRRLQSTDEPGYIERKVDKRLTEAELILDHVLTQSLSAEPFQITEDSSDITAHISGESMPQRRMRRIRKKISILKVAHPLLSKGRSELFEQQARPLIETSLESSFTGETDRMMASSQKPKAQIFITKTAGQNALAKLNPKMRPEDLTGVPKVEVRISTGMPLGDIMNIKRTVLSIIPSSLRERFRESSGLLFGEVAGNKYVVKRAIPVTKYAKRTENPVEFDREELLRIFDLEEVKGMKMLGVYHTHPIEYLFSKKHEGPSYQDRLNEDILLPERKERIAENPIGILFEPVFDMPVSNVPVHDLDKGLKPSDVKMYVYATDPDNQTGIITLSAESSLKLLAKLGRAFRIKQKTTKPADDIPKTLPQFLETVNNAGYDSIYHMLRDSINDHNRKGEGSRAVVYNIPKIPNLVLRIEKPEEANFQELEDELLAAFTGTEEIEMARNPFGDRNFGQAIITIGPKIEILRRQYDESAGVRRYEGKSHRSSWDDPERQEGMREEKYEKLKQNHRGYWDGKYRQHIRNMARIGQESYNELALDAKFAEEIARHYIDPFGENIMINSHNNRMGWIDMPNSYNVVKNNLGRFVTALMEIKYAVAYYEPEAKHNTAKAKEIEALNREILTKAIIAAGLAKLSLPDENDSFFDVMLQAAFVLSGIEMEEGDWWAASIKIIEEYNRLHPEAKISAEDMVPSTDDPVTEEQTSSDEAQLSASKANAENRLLNGNRLPLTPGATGNLNLQPSSSSDRREVKRLAQKGDLAQLGRKLQPRELGGNEPYNQLVARFKPLAEKSKNQVGSVILVSAKTVGFVDKMEALGAKDDKAMLALIKAALNDVNRLEPGKNIFRIPGLEGYVVFVKEGQEAVVPDDSRLLILDPPKGNTIAQVGTHIAVVQKDNSMMARLAEKDLSGKLTQLAQFNLTKPHPLIVLAYPKEEEPQEAINGFAAVLAKEASNKKFDGIRGSPLFIARAEAVGLKYFAVNNSQIEKTEVPLTSISVGIILVPYKQFSETEKANLPAKALVDGAAMPGEKSLEASYATEEEIKALPQNNVIEIPSPVINEVPSPVSPIVPLPLDAPMLIKDAAILSLSNAELNEGLQKAVKISRTLNSKGLGGLPPEVRERIIRAVERVYLETKKEVPGFEIKINQFVHSLISAANILRGNINLLSQDKRYSQAILEALGEGKTFAERAAELAAIRILEKEGVVGTMEIWVPNGTLIDGMQSQKETMQVLQKINEIADITRIRTDKNKPDEYFEESPSDVTVQESDDSGQKNILTNFVTVKNAKLKLRFAETEGILRRANYYKYHSPNKFDEKILRVLIDEPQTFFEQATRIKSPGEIYGFLQAERPDLLNKAVLEAKFILEVYRRVKLMEGMYPGLYDNPYIKDPRTEKDTGVKDRLRAVISAKYDWSVRKLHGEFISKSKDSVPEIFVEFEDFKRLVDEVATVARMVEGKDFDRHVVTPKTEEAETTEQKRSSRGGTPPKPSTEEGLKSAGSKGFSRNLYSIRSESWVVRPNTILGNKEASALLTARIAEDYLSDATPGFSEDDAIRHIVNAFYSNPQESVNIAEAIAHKDAGVGKERTDYTTATGQVIERPLRSFDADIARVSEEELKTVFDKLLKTDVLDTHTDKIQKLVENILRVQKELSKRGKVGQMVYGPDSDLRSLYAALAAAAPNLEAKKLIRYIGGTDPEKNEEEINQAVKDLQAGNELIVLMAGDPTGGNAFSKNKSLRFGATHLTSLRGLTSLTQWLGRAGSTGRVGTEGILPTWYVTVDLEDNYLLQDEKEELKNLSREQRARKVFDAANQIDAQIALRSVYYIQQVTHVQATAENMRGVINALEGRSSAEYNRSDIASGIKDETLSDKMADKLLDLMETRSKESFVKLRGRNLTAEEKKEALDRLYIADGLLTPEGKALLDLVKALRDKLDNKKLDELIKRFGFTPSFDEASRAKAMFDVAEILHGLGAQRRDIPFIRVLFALNLTGSIDQLRDDIASVRASKSPVPFVDVLYKKAKAAHTGNVKLLKALEAIMAQADKLQKQSNKYSAKRAALHEARQHRQARDANDLVRRAKQLSRSRQDEPQATAADKIKEFWLDITVGRGLSKKSEKFRRASDIRLGLVDEITSLTSEAISPVEFMQALGVSRNAGNIKSTVEAEKMLEFIRAISPAKWLENQGVETALGMAANPFVMADILKGRVSSKSENAAVLRTISRLAEEHAVVDKGEVEALSLPLASASKKTNVLLIGLSLLGIPIFIIAGPILHLSVWA